MVRKFTYSLYFHCCYQCFYMNIALIFFFFSASRPVKRPQPPKSSFLYCFDRCPDYFTEKTSWSCKLWQNNDALWKHPSFTENIRKLPISIIRTTDYSKEFLRSLTLRIIEVWLYFLTYLFKHMFWVLIETIILSTHNICYFYKVNTGL